MADFKKLEVWQKSQAIAIEADRVVGRIRKAQHVSLRSNIVRAARAIPKNIVEGRAQETDAEFGKCLRSAVNAATELEYHLITARDFEAMRKTDFLSLLNQTIRVRKMLYGLIHRLDTPDADE